MEMRSFLLHSGACFGAFSVLFDRNESLDNDDGSLFDQHLQQRSVATSLASRLLFLSPAMNRQVSFLLYDHYDLAVKTKNTWVMNDARRGRE